MNDRPREICASSLTQWVVDMEHEWDDFLGVRVRVSPRPRSRRFYQTIDYQPPSGWGSPIARKLAAMALLGGGD
jgi:hypothetical protein